MPISPLLGNASGIFNQALKRSSADKPRKRDRPATDNIDDKTLNLLAYSLGWLFINPASISASESALLHYGGKWPLRIGLLSCPEYLLSLYLRDATFANKHLWSPDDWQNYALYREEQAQEFYKHSKRLEQKIYFEKKLHCRRKPKSTEGKSPVTLLLGALYQNPKTKPKRGPKLKDYSERDAILKEAKDYQSSCSGFVSKITAIEHVAKLREKTPLEIKELTKPANLNRWSKTPAG